MRNEGVDFSEVEYIPKDWPLPPRLYLDGINIEPELPNELYITDTTFRDGQQAFYAYSTEDIVSLFRMLSELDNGSGRIIRSEFFLYTERDRRIVRILRDLDIDNPRIIGWGRARFEDVRLVKEAGLDEMVMLMSISDIHIKYKFNSTRDKVIPKYLEVAEQALRDGISLRCSFEDVTRSDVLGVAVPLARRLMELSERYGVPVTIKLPDTVGVGLPYPFASLPQSVPKIVWVLRKLASVPNDRLEFHGHGDHYMGVANAVSAWLYGASINNGTLLGIGERAGNVPIEALIIWYARLKGSFDGMNPAVLRKIVNYFSRIGYNVPTYQPIVGPNAFATAAGIHIDAQLKNPETYLSMDPALVGNEARITIGPYSGTSGVAYWLRSRFGFNVEKDGELVRRIYERIIEMYNNGNRREPLSDEEMERIVKEFI